MTSRVGLKGQVVIPKPLRDRLGIRPGDEVDFTLEEGGVLVAPAVLQDSLRGTLARFDLVAALEDEHRRERDR